MPTPYVISRLYTPVVRLRVTPDEPAEGPPAITAQRPRGSLRPHTDMTVAKVRHLIEQTDLTYRQIAAKTGVSPYSISNWARDGAWQRPPGAPRATNNVPDVRAGRKLKLRKLATRLEALAERCVRELEAAPRVDVETLMQALQVLKMARLEARRRRRRPAGTPRSKAWTLSRDEAVRTALEETRRSGVDIDRAPKEAVEMVIAANTPVEDHPALRPRGRRSQRNRHHAWMLEKE